MSNDETHSREDEYVEQDDDDSEKPKNTLNRRQFFTGVAAALGGSWLLNRRRKELFGGNPQPSAETEDAAAAPIVDPEVDGDGHVNSSNEALQGAQSVVSKNEHKKQPPRYIELQEEYIVKEGDSIASIARSFEEKSLSKGYIWEAVYRGILDKNMDVLQNANKIHPGLELHIYIDTDVRFKAPE